MQSGEDLYFRLIAPNGNPSETLMTVQQFKEALTTMDEDDIVDHVILGTGAAHLTGAQILGIQRRISQTFGYVTAKGFLHSGKSAMAASMNTMRA